MLFKKVALKILNQAVHFYGYSIVERGQGYFDPKSITIAAEKETLSVCDYLEKHDVGGVGKRRDLIISSISKYLNKKQNSILEIGAGTGMFLEKIIEEYHPKKAEIYETSVGWSDYLLKTYSKKVRLICHNPDGKSLRQSSDNSIDTVFAHGVFVYLPLINTFSYLIECVRVVKSGGLIIFDCFSDQYFDLDIIREWQKDVHVFPVVISQSLLTDFFRTSKLDLVTTIQIPYHSSDCTYYILRKK